MPIINKGTSLSNGEQLTADKLNDLLDLATFTQDATDSQTTDVNSAGQIRVNPEGIDTAQLADGAVTSAKLASGGLTENLLIKNDGTVFPNNLDGGLLQLSSSSGVARLSLDPNEILCKTSMSIRVPQTEQLQFQTNNSAGTGSVTNMAVKEGQVDVSGSLKVSTNDPNIILQKPPASDDREQTRLTIGTADANAAFEIQTATSSGTFVSNDYRIEKDASGANKHELRIGNELRAELIDTSLSVNTGNINLYGRDSNGDGNKTAGIELNSNLSSGDGFAYIDFHSQSATNPDYDARIYSNSNGNFVLTNKSPIGGGVYIQTTNSSGTTSNALQVDADANVRVRGDITGDNNTGRTGIFGGLVNNGAHIELYSGSHDNGPNKAFYDAVEHNFRSVSGSSLNGMRIDTGNGKLLVGALSGISVTAVENSVVCEGRIQAKGSYTSTSSISPNLAINSDGMISRSTSPSVTPYTGGESVTLPNGLIMKFGSVNLPSDGESTVTFAVPFPSGFVSAVACFSSTFSTSSDAGIGVRLGSKNSMKVRNGAGGAQTANWQAIGY